MCTGSSQRKHKEKGGKNGKWTFEGDSQSWGSSSVPAALCQDVLQAGGRKSWQGLLTPPCSLGFQQGVIYTPALLLFPARSLQTAPGARWSCCHTAPSSGKPFLGNPKSQALQQVLPKPGRFSGEDVGLGGAKEEQAPRGGLCDADLPEWPCILSGGICASSPEGSRA